MQDEPVAPERPARTVQTTPTLEDTNIEEAVRRSVEVLQASHPSPIFLVDAQARILACPAWLDEGTSGGAIGRTLADIVAKDGDPSTVQTAVGNALHPGLSHAVDLPLDTPSGPRWYQATISPIRSDEGIQASLVVTQDVTARRQEEQRLRRSERLMVDTQDVAHLGTWEWDVTEPNAVWSDQLYKIYGLDPSSHTPSYQDYLTRVHPDDREQVERATEGVFQRLEPYSHDERILRPDGEVRYLHTWAEPVLDEEGHLVRLVGVCQDITDRKLAELGLERREAHFRALFDEAAMGIATLTLDGRIREPNPALTRMLVGSSEAELDDRVLGPTHPEDRGVLQAALEAAASEPGASERLEARFFGPDLETFWAHVTLSRVDPGSGGDPFLVAMVEDVSSRKAAEKALETRAQELKRMNEELERFTYISSHDLKEPLRMVTSYVQLLEQELEDQLDEDTREYMGYAVEGAKRMNRLIDDLIAYTHLGDGAEGVGPVELDEVVQEAVLNLSRQIEQTHGDVQVERPLPTVPGRRADLILLFQNLLANALKFTDGERPVVRIGAEQDGAGVVIHVRDEGIGIDEAHQEVIFSIFKRLHARDAYPGTGLGLALARKIVEDHGGRIWVESTPGEGSTFSFKLPKRAPASDARAPASA